MESHFGLNFVTFFLILPIVILVLISIVWFAIKSKVTKAQRIVIAFGSPFAFVGFCVLLLVIYYQLNPTFAKSFQYFAYATTASSKNPFLQHDGYTGQLLSLRTVQKKDGRVILVDHPNPDFPTEVTVFVQGQYIQAQQKNNVLSIPNDEPNSLPRVTKVTLFWALTKSLFRINNP